MKEVWKTIEDFPTYAVSTLGRVKRIVDSTRWQKAGLLLTPYLNGCGYLRVGLSREKKKHNVFIHRAVAKAFIPNPWNLPEVNHKGKKSDNRAHRLEWVSKATHRIDKAKRKQQGDGIFYHPFGKYQAYLPDPKTVGKRIYLGFFVTKKEALKARKNAIDKFYGGQG